MMKYRIIGVDKESGMDTELTIEAATSGNAKVKAELKGIIVTEVIDASRPAKALPPAEEWPPIAEAARKLASRPEVNASANEPRSEPAPYVWANRRKSTARSVEHGVLGAVAWVISGMIILALLALIIQAYS